MIRSIFLKEWLKLRFFFLGAMVVNLSVCLKILLDVRQRFHSEHAEMLWYQAIHIRSVFYSDLRFLPLAAGLTIGLAQFIPEIQQRRLRLSLHLPLGRNPYVISCLAVGSILYFTVVSINSLAIFSFTRHYFPGEVALTTLITMFPWVCAGYMAYCGVIKVLLEPAMFRRVFTLLVFTGLIALLFKGTGYSWYGSAWEYQFLLSLLSLFAVFEAGRRFQQGGGS